MEFRVSLYLFIWPIPDWRSLNRTRCSRLKVGLRNGVCAFFGTKLAMRLKTRTDYAVANIGKNYLEKTSKPYPDCYSPKPYSKSFVLHLDMWYAQSHPDEDFAETFAVWLTPGSQWKERYVGWPALKKIEYVDSLMRELAGVPPFVTKRRRVDPLPALRKTLREHYRHKREKYGLDYPNFYDRDLGLLFSNSTVCEKNLPAASFIRRFRKEVRRKAVRLDRRLSIHDRSGFERYDRTLSRTEIAFDRSRRSGQG